MLSGMRLIMKKLISVLLTVILCLSVGAALTGCDSPSVAVSSALEINSAFSGTRTVDIMYPLSVDIDGIKDVLVEDSPASDIDGAEFSYIGVEEDGYHFELKLSFTDREQYESIVSGIIGRSASSVLSLKNTSLTKGTRMAEDFDVSELISWIERDTADSKDLKSFGFDYGSNTVKIGLKSYDTGSTVSINDCEGSRITSVSVMTANYKDGKYDRTIVFRVPNETYLHNKDAVEEYFLSNTSPDAEYSGWTAEGSNMLYSAIFNGVDLEKLNEVTSMLLDTDSGDIYYGDRDNNSTPLSEGMSFEETVDTFSFIGPDNGFPKLEYAYSLPESTTHGDGSVFENGKWVGKGSWEEGVCRLTLDSGAGRISIPDGIQYAINGINFRLVSLGDNRFRRSTEFLYSKTDGYDGMSYANKFFLSKGVDSEIGDDGDNLTCTVTSEGTVDEITSDLVKLFGSGNFMAYRRSEGTFSLTVKTELTDYVNLGYMLNSANANRPMTYYVSSQGGDNIVSVSVDGDETAYTDHSSSSLPVNGGCATVEYHGNIPIISHIVIYSVTGSVLLILTAFVAVMLLKPKKKRRRLDDPINNPEAYMGDAPSDGEDDSQPDDASDNSGSGHTPAADLTQTTTFSIFELNALVRNKKYVDEINKDIEQRIHEDSLRNKKNDIRARELEEMSRMVYGTPAQAQDGNDTAQDAPGDAPDGNSENTAEGSQAEPDSAPAADADPQSDMPGTQTDLQSADREEQSERGGADV